MIQKIDSHAHILPKQWPSLKEKFGYGGFIVLEHHAPGRAKMMRDDGTFFREIEENCWNPEAILVDMAQHNVQTMVLCTVPVLFSYWAKPQDGLEWSILLNDHLAGVCMDYPGKFIGLGTLPMQDVTLAIQELQRCKSLGFPGVQIGSNINGVNLDSPEFHRLWQACIDLDMAVFVHPWDMLGASRTEQYFQQWLIGMPAETTLAITSMIFGGVFKRFPRLRVMFAHAGGSIAFTLGRITHGFFARPDLCNVHDIESPSSYIGKFWVDGITHNQDALRYLIQTVGIDHICYGTDYPFPLGDLEHGAFIESMADLTVDQQTKIFRSNVCTWLNIRVPIAGQ
jgi:aminocarboxymuconate-semialdehyde decarboxylase